MRPEERADWRGFIEDDGFAHECDHPLCGRGWVCHSCQQVQMILGVRKRGDWTERPEDAAFPKAEGDDGEEAVDWWKRKPSGWSGNDGWAVRIAAAIRARGDS